MLLIDTAACVRRKRVRIRPASDGGHRLGRKPSTVGSQSQSDCQDALIPEVPTELVERTVEYASVICWATIAASSPTPISSEDFRLRKKGTPTKYSPGITVLAPSCVSGNPQVSKASGHGSHER